MTKPFVLILLCKKTVLNVEAHLAEGKFLVIFSSSFFGVIAAGDLFLIWCAAQAFLPIVPIVIRPRGLWGCASPMRSSIEGDRNRLFLFRSHIEIHDEFFPMIFLIRESFDKLYRAHGFVAIMPTKSLGPSFPGQVESVTHWDSNGSAHANNGNGRGHPETVFLFRSGCR